MYRVAATVFLMSLAAYFSTVGAELLDRGGGLVYDTDLDVTWLSDANYAVTDLSIDRVNEIIAVVGTVEGHVLGPDDFLWDQTNSRFTGQMTWWGAVAWVNSLVYTHSTLGVSYSNWRLPLMQVSDSTCGNSSGVPESDSMGYNCVGGELGHLHYNELGRHMVPDSYTAPNSSAAPIFNNLQDAFYFYNTAAVPCRNLPGADCSPYFSFFSGFQWVVTKSNHNYVMPVLDGDVALLPLSIEISSPPGVATKNKFYRWDGLLASGGQPPYTFSLAGGGLPWPMTLNPQTGVIAGTPAIVTTANFTVQVMDANSDTATIQLQITVTQRGGCYRYCHSAEHF